MKDNTTKISKAMSLLLRHKPEAGHISLDAQGWVSIDDLIIGLTHLGQHATATDIEHIVATNDKQRFIINGNRIRANQGHSVTVELGLPPATPPAVLYHGTVQKFLSTIFRDGLQKRKRHHVHLSADVTTATTVGDRRGQAVILNIDAARMHADGHQFFVTANQVWLTDHVPPSYLYKD